MANCDCTSKQGTIRIADHGKFVSGKSEIGSANSVRLFKCTVCGQHWLLDVWDKFKEQFAFKIKDASHWEKMDTTPLRKAYLLLSKGGVTAENCNVDGCKGHKVKGAALCVDHLYSVGVKK